MSPKLKQFLWQWRSVRFAVPLAGIVMVVRLAGWLQNSELAVFDLYKRWRPSDPTDSRIAIVGIDEDDFRHLNQGVISDRVLAQLIEKLKAMEPRAIGLDIYRDLPVEPGHQELIRVYESTPNLIGIQKLVGDPRTEAVAPPPQLKASGQVGANDMKFDRDNVVRRGYLRIGSKDESLESFALYLAAAYLEAEGIAPQVPAGTTIFQFGDSLFPRFARNDGSYVRTDDKSYQTLLNYRGPAGHFPTASLIDILQGRVAPEWGRDRLILIGYVGESFQDLHATPHTTNPSERMAGVEIHAHLASQIISQVLDGRSPINTLSEPLEYLWIFSWLGVGLGIVWAARPLKPKFLLWLLVVGAGTLLAAGGAIAMTSVAFLESWWLPVVPPLLVLVGSPVAMMMNESYRAIRIRHTFGRYLSDEIVATLLEHPEGLRLGGEKRKITLLVSDLRGFTTISESLSPDAVVKILNFYLEQMANVITEYQGTIDEFMGDGILVLFGAPVSRQDDAERAVAAAIAMQLAMESVNTQMQQWGFPELAMGIGINTGEVVVGNLGSEKRTKYGVVGHEVNLTYRIESYTVGGQILIAETALQAAGNSVQVGDSRQVSPKGVKEPLTVYEVRGIEGKDSLCLPQENELFVSLPIPIAIQYVRLQGKDLGHQEESGSIVRLSLKGVEICGDRSEQTRLSSLDNLRLRLHQSGEENYFYAKVLQVEQASQRFQARLTTVPAEIKAKLDALYYKQRPSGLGKETS
ncbi:MAG: CHASE2 domain-containing protein [Cyanophyceae cyanobacterium]